MPLTYTQWFALLSLKHFSPERACAEIRENTLRSLVRRCLAIANEDGSYSITELGTETENAIERAPRG